jgi:hypothetical protein
MQAEVAWKADEQQVSAMLPCLPGSSQLLYSEAGPIQNVRQKTARPVIEVTFK